MAGRKGMRVHRYTEAELNWLRAHAPGNTWKELAALFNQRFHTNQDWRSIHVACHRRAIKGGTGDGRFRPGNPAWNRGLKGVNGDSPVRFQPGNRPHNRQPVGTERNAGGWIEIKVAEPNRWRSKAMLLWEQRHGRQVPDGHVVLFADGDRRNFDPANLLLVSRAELAVMNKRRLIVPGFGEGTRAGQVIARVVLARRRRQLERKRPAKAHGIDTNVGTFRPTAEQPTA